jgi:hypothetical protein
MREVAKKKKEQDTSQIADSGDQVVMRQSNMGKGSGLGALVLCALMGCNQSVSPTPASSSSAGDSGPVASPAGPPIFEDVTATTGITFTYRNGEEANHYAIIESLGGGVALIDYDQDGLLDIFLTGGGYYVGTKVLGHPCKLYRNLGQFRFQDVTAQVGLDAISFPYSHGAAAFDYDRDGWPDLLITGYNRLVLLKNVADDKNGRRFIDVTAAARLNDNLWSTSAAWGDLDGDGYPEIYVAHYGDWGFETNHPTDCTYDGKTRDVCQPRRFKPLPHTLYRNNRDGTFTDISEACKIRKDGKGIGVIMVDVNNDGRPDIYVANDTDDNHLYINRSEAGQIRLEEIGLFAGVARDDRGIANGSMGLDAADYNHSGWASLIVTNYENELPALYKNRSDAKQIRFLYDTMPSGLAVIGGTYVSWGVGFFDFDWDGWQDLLIVSGHAIRYPIKLDRRQKPQLLRNVQGRFRVITSQGGSYCQQPHNARGAAFGDLDNDGRIDVVISHLNEPVSVLRNVYSASDHHWLGLHLHGAKHADIVGTRVVLETAQGKQTTFVKGGASYASTNDPRLLFGLGSTTTIQNLTIYWSSGTVQKVTGLEADAYWAITEGDNSPQRLHYPPSTSSTPTTPTHESPKN